MAKSNHTDGYGEAQRRIAAAKQSGDTELDLSDLGLTEVPPEIGSLIALTWLNLSDNQLSELPPGITSLTVLEDLYLDANLFIELPPEIASLSSLLWLVLSENQLNSIPADIGSLTTLEYLKLSNNRLTCLPPEIGLLSLLQVLHLSDNQLTALPREMVSLTALEELYLHDNPRLGLPAEVLGPTRNECIHKNAKPKPAREILKYYFDTLAGARALREVKLILVGRGTVGKSTLADALQGKPFIENRPATEGIKITPWRIETKGGEAVVHLWDFGGQEIMHGTHQFFLTKRAIYIVMVDGRDGRYQRDAEYWLKHVRLFGGDSHILVIMNRQKAWKFDLDRNALAKKYDVEPDLFFPTECSENDGVESVCEAIRHLVGEVLATEANFPAKWWTIKTHLEEMEEDYLSDKAYRELCCENGIEDAEKQEQLLDRLHDLGVVVHFGNDVNLAELKVLDPEWATDGVYRVITNEELREEKQGKLRAGTLKSILPKKRWPENIHRRYILDLMRRFDLCFRAEGEDDLYIVPELLPEQTPDLSGWDAKSCVVFRYDYPVLPRGILPRFISKTHTRSEGRHRWRSGVVVGDEGAEALVRADYEDHTVDIWVQGDYADARRGLLMIIRSRFKEIHDRIKGLDPKEMVGVPQHPTVFVSYRDMILDERDGKPSVRVTIAGERVDVPLDTILSGIASKAERAKATKKEMSERQGSVHIHNGDIVRGDKLMNDDHSINIGGNVTNSQIGQTLTNCNNIISEQPPGKKKALLEELERQVQRLIERLPDEKKDEAAEDFKMLVEQATSEKPNRKWYSVSAEGLLDASEFVKDFSGNIAGTIFNLGKMIWPGFLLGQEDR